MASFIHFGLCCLVIKQAIIVIMTKRYWYFCGMKKIRRANGSGEGSSANIGDQGPRAEKNRDLC